MNGEEQKTMLSWQGTLHRVVPAEEPYCSEGYWNPSCNRGNYLAEREQKHQTLKRECKRCFPVGRVS